MSDPILNTINQYRQAEKWLWSLITDPSGSRYFQEKSMETRMVEFREQIERMHAFLDFIGNPEEQFPAIHVAGTSGKGSVVSMLAEMLSTTGLRVGHHVSPYLQVCNEKLIVDRRLIAPSQFVELVEDFRQKYQAWLEADERFTALKYGEAWVAMTYLWMARQQVDWAVIETGLGGRFDPTNVIPSRLAVITNVDFDHTEVLGETLPEIAWHKAGIIKPGGLAITAETKPGALEMIKAEAEEKAARLFCLGEHFSYQIGADDQGQYLDVDGVFNQFRRLRVVMKGGFQLHNAALAVASLDLLAGELGLDFNESHAREGLLNVNYAGRLELMQQHPVVILDGAHNRNKAEALADSLESLYPGKKLTVVLGTLSIKDFGGIIHALLPSAGKWIATQPKVFGKPSASPEQLAEVIREVDPEADVQQAGDVRSALQLALSQAQDDEIIMVTGSLYMIGDARAYWFPTEQLLYDLEKGISPD